MSVWPVILPLVKWEGTTTSGNLQKLVTSAFDVYLTGNEIWWQMTHKVGLIWVPHTLLHASYSKNHPVLLTFNANVMTHPATQTSLVQWRGAALETYPVRLGTPQLINTKNSSFRTGLASKSLASRELSLLSSFCPFVKTASVNFVAWCQGCFTEEGIPMEPSNFSHCTWPCSTSCPDRGVRYTLVSSKKRHLIPVRRQFSVFLVLLIFQSFPKFFFFSFSLANISACITFIYQTFDFIEIIL